MDIWLSDYISYNDHVTMEDLALAFERARRDRFADRKFACVTHSTGGPLMREWWERFGQAAGCHLSHLVMLAPPNHGSALAQIGKSRLARTVLWLEHTEPGEAILDWLELGSEQSWNLNLRWLDFPWRERGVYPFVLTGGSPDHKLYDHLNSYTGEAGSDGVVRVASANLNFNFLRLKQGEDGALSITESRRSAPSAFGVLPGLAHCGAAKGILASITAEKIGRAHV